MLLSVFLPAGSNIIRLFMNFEMEHATVNVRIGHIWVTWYIEQSVFYFYLILKEAYTVFERQKLRLTCMKLWHKWTRASGNMDGLLEVVLSFLSCAELRSCINLHCVRLSCGTCIDTIICSNIWIKKVVALTCIVLNWH